MQDDQGGKTLVSMVVETLEARIASRNLAPGAKLPSVRGLAAALKVSVSTVVDAYARLVAEGVIFPRRGSGFYVAKQAAPFSVTLSGPKLDRAVDPFWVSKQSLDAAEDHLKPGCGWLPSSWLPEEAIRRALRSLARGDVTSLADYGSPLGLPPLRQLLARRLADRAIEASPDQIMLTESGTQAIDLLCRFLLEPGDTVLVDDPCYFNFHAILRAHRAKIVAVPYTSQGPDLDCLAETLQEHRPRLYVTNSGIHNPTGATLSPVVAHRVLKLAEQHDLIIVEDDIFADFEDMAAPRLAAFDGLQRVIHIGSFSKTLSASARCGFIVAKPDWIEGLTDLKIATSFGGGRMTAELVLNVLNDRSYRQHVEHVRVRLAETRYRVSADLGRLDIRPVIEPKAGMFLWCQLPDGVDAAKLARMALEDKVVLAPGNAFSLSQTATGFMRFNVSQCTDPRVFDVLGKALRRLR